MPNWTVSPEWSGETAFLIGGGPSVADQNIELLRGRKVIVINSSCYLVPWADVLFFADMRWWRENLEAVASFQGRVVTSCEEVRHPKILNVKRKMPPGLSLDASELTVLKTSMTAAINLAVHLGANKIVTLGLDGGPQNGRTHHHKPHNWGEIAANWQLQREELSGIAPDLARLGIEVLNASPGSALNCWPIVRLDQVLKMETGRG